MGGTSSLLLTSISASKEPGLGDHLVISCGFYSHHGIYVGGGRCVHKSAGSTNPLLTGLVKKQSVASVPGGSRLGFEFGGVEEVSLEDFAGGADRIRLVRVVRYGPGRLPAFAPEDTAAIARAGAAAGPSATAATALHAHGRLKAPGHGHYRLLAANCEHFATGCKTGVRESLQAARFRNALGNLQTLAGATLAGTAVLARLALRYKRWGGLARVTRTVTTTTETTSRGGGLLSLGGQVEEVTTTRTVVRRAPRTPAVVAAALAFAAASALGAATMRVWRRSRRRRLLLRLALRVDGDLLRLSGGQPRPELDPDSNSNSNQPGQLKPGQAADEAQLRQLQIEVVAAARASAGGPTPLVVTARCRRDSVEELVARLLLLAAAGTAAAPPGATDPASELAPANDSSSAGTQEAAAAQCELLEASWKLPAAAASPAARPSPAALRAAVLRLARNDVTAEVYDAALGRYVPMRRPADLPAAASVRLVPRVRVEPQTTSRGAERLQDADMQLACS